MERFAELLERLYFTGSNTAKAQIIKRYLKDVPDPDRGWAVAAMAGTLNFDLFKRNLVKTLVTQRVDPLLFDLSYDYVGETSETVALLWPPTPEARPLAALPSLSEVVEEFKSRTKAGISEYLVTLLDAMSPSQRWALLKLGTRTLRIGVSARFLKKVLADYGGVAVEDIERLWHALEPPYVSLLQWLDGQGPKPEPTDQLVFHPVMLSHPLEEADYDKIVPGAWQAEWKYDGIRVQLVSTGAGQALFSRTGDDIGGSFPDVLARVDFHAVLDGELLVRQGEQIASFNELQQRLNKKKPSAKLLQDYPAHLMLYDALVLDGEDITPLPLAERRQKLEAWLEHHEPRGTSLSPILPFKSFTELENLRANAEQTLGPHIEGLMLKRMDSAYVPGRPKGQWYKWKRAAQTVDAVMMYAQRGHGKRSSFYSDYTFGLWDGEQLLPIGKAYSGFTDQELRRLDRWVREHTVGRFGPVREVEKSLVLEVAFDAVQSSTRHKSGLALRFPRISRIRWDKPAGEADRLEPFRQFHRL